MSQDTTQVPMKVEVREFYNALLEEALRDCQKEGYQALFMPQIVDVRIDAPKYSTIWQSSYYAPSIRATGRTKQNNPVVVYAHIPNYFSNPDNIKTAKEQGLVNEAGIIPEEEFQRLLDLQDDKSVFVIDYNNLKTSTSEVISLKDALKHPQTIPFLAGQERAERYLERHMEVYGDKIGIWHSDELKDKSLGRCLFLGSGYDGDLSGDGNLGNSGRFVGVRDAEGVQKISVPTLDQIIRIINEYIAPVNRDEVTQRITELFK